MAAYVISSAAAEQVAYRNTSLSVAYIGSRACAGCHPQIYKDYSRTVMGRSMTLAAVPEQLAKVADATPVYSEQLNRHFEVSRQGTELYQAEYEMDDSGHEVFRTTHKLDYVIGSGTNGYTYLVRRGDYLFQAPLSYYVQKRAWGLSPGYEAADNGFNRPIAAACIACHSGRPQAVRDRAGLFRDPPFLELAIGCESCHGPGALHAAETAQGRHRSGTSDLGIVNPARLPASLAEDICMNCHQGGDTRILWPGKNYSDFRPGTPLYQTLAILRIPRERSTAGDADLLEHHFSMHISRCYRASGGRLSCFTCHQIHAIPRSSEAAAFYRARCLTCHSDASCKLPKPQRARQADDCVKCHMPKRQVEIIAHSALTNHRIPARLGEPLPDATFAPSTPGTPDLIFWNAPADSKAHMLPPIMLLQAYGELMEKEPLYQIRYLALLDELAKSTPDEPLVQASLGSKMLRSEPGSYNPAIEHLTRAIELGFSAPSVYADLAEALARANREEEAAQTLERGIRLSPYVPVLYKSLALRLIHLERYTDARETMERYMERFPEDDFMRGLLRKVGGTASSNRK